MTQVEPPPVFQLSPAQESLPGSPGTGDGVEAPGALAGLRIVRIDEAADAGLAAAGSDQHFAANGERRERQAVAELVVLDLGGPTFDAALQVERDEVAVQGRDEELVVEDGGPAVDMTEADRLVVLGQRPAPLPELAAGADIERRRRVGRGHIHHAVDDDGRDLRAAFGELFGPLDVQAGDVGRRDSGEGREAMALIVAGVGEPVARLLRSVDDPLVRRLGEGATAKSRRAYRFMCSLQRDEIGDQVVQFGLGELAFEGRHGRLLFEAAQLFEPGLAIAVEPAGRSLIWMVKVSSLTRMPRTAGPTRA